MDWIIIIGIIIFFVIVFFAFAYPWFGLLLILLLIFAALKDKICDGIADIVSGMKEAKLKRISNHKKAYQSDMKFFYGIYVDKCDQLDSFFAVDEKKIRSEDHLIDLLSICTNRKIKNAYMDCIRERDEELVKAVKHKADELNFSIETSNKSVADIKKWISETRKKWKVDQARIDRYSFEQVKKIYKETKGKKGNKARKQKLCADIPIVLIITFVVGVLSFDMIKDSLYNSRYHYICEFITTACETYGDNAQLVVANRDGEKKTFDVGYFWYSNTNQVSFRYGTAIINDIIIYKYGYDNDYDFDGKIATGWYVFAGILLIPLIISIKRRTEW